MKVSDIVLVSDLDGTIINIDGEINEKNYLAINKFKDLGGIFTIATGRSPRSAQLIAKTLNANNYIVANNGATIYDIEQNKTVWTQELPLSYKKIVNYVKENFKEVGIELISSDGEYHIVTDNEISRGLIRGTDFSMNHIEDENYPDDICKVLFVAKRPFFYKFVEHMYSKGFEDVVLVESGGDCFEMMAKDISKGSTLKRLAELYDRKVENLAAIGDYFNDIEMIKAAKIGAAMENAVLPLKEIADITVSSCKDGGLAEFIEYLINQSK